MRISDWSSDVCSSDLQITGVDITPGLFRRTDDAGNHRRFGKIGPQGSKVLQEHFRQRRNVRIDTEEGEQRVVIARFQKHAHARGQQMGNGRQLGSEDRKSTPSELQSLMRTSYAAFCLNKKQK